MSTFSGNCHVETGVPKGVERCTTDSYVFANVGQILELCKQYYIMGANSTHVLNVDVFVDGCGASMVAETSDCGIHRVDLDTRVCDTVFTLLNCVIFGYFLSNTTFLFRSLVDDGLLIVW